MAAQLHFGTGDSITFGTTGSNTASTASGSTSSLTNIVVGDLLVAWIHGQTTASGTITPPSGWTQYGASPGSPSYSASRLSSFYYYPVTSTTDITNLPATLTWTFSVSGGRVGCVLARATGIDLNNIEDSASTSFTNTGSLATLNIAGITTVNATTLLVGGFAHQNSAVASPYPATPTTTSFMTSFQEYLTNPDQSVGTTGSTMGYSYLTSAGATGTVAATLDSTAVSLEGEVVAFTAGTWTPPSGVPAVVGTPTTYASTSTITAFTISTPSGLADNDLLVMALSAQSATATGDFTCTGWSRISAAFVASSTSYRNTAFFALPVPLASSAASTYTFTSTDTGGGRIAASMFIVRGADLTTITSAVSTYAGSASVTSISVSSITPAVANNLLLVTYNAQVTSGNSYTVSSGPSGLTSLIDQYAASGNGTVTRLVVYQGELDAVASGSETLTWAGTASQSSGVSIAIRAPDAAPTNDGLDIHYTSAPDTMSAGKIFYTSGTDTLATPAEIRPVPTGYASVSDMFAQSPFYVAHRGGSLDWPEMSLHAYTQSVFWGVGAVELSLARTTDGVWFGLHDASLDRTSLGTGDGSGTTLVASSMTWAQVQTYQIQYPSVTNASSLPQPYMRWEEIIAAYYGTHVIFVDPKHATSYTSEILNMMDACGSTPTNHFVAKSYGPTGNAGNTTGFPHDAAARGYKNWGYFYEADYENSNLMTFQGRYDILGMDYSATSAAWTAVLSYGKPVIGHVVPSAAAASTALGYGAAGLMVSGVQEVITRTSDPNQNF